MCTLQKEFRRRPSPWPVHTRHLSSQLELAVGRHTSGTQGQLPTGKNQEEIQAERTQEPCTRAGELGAARARGWDRGSQPGSLPEWEGGLRALHIL